LSIWVLLAGSSPSSLVLLREFHGTDYFLEDWDELERRRAFLRFRSIQFEGVIL
jgi:hypothetical protein